MKLNLVKLIKYIATLISLLVLFSGLKAQSPDIKKKYTIQLAEYASSVPQEDVEKLMQIIGIECRNMENGNAIYTVGNFSTLDEANAAADKCKGQGFLNAKAILNDAKSDQLPTKIANNTNTSVNNQLQTELKDTTQSQIIQENKDTDRSDTIKNKFSGQYAILLEQFDKDLPLDVIDKFLSLQGAIITRFGETTYYAIKAVQEIEEAQSRIAAVKDMGFANAHIVKLKNDSTSDIDSTFIPNIQRPILPKINTSELVFRVQLGALTNQGASEFFIEKGITDVIYFTVDGYTKYYTGSYTTYEDAMKHKILMQQKGFADAFISAYKDGKRLEINDAIKFASNTPNVSDPSDSSHQTTLTKVVLAKVVYKIQIGALKNTVTSDLFKDITDLATETTENGYTRIITGNYTTYEEAKINEALLKEKGYEQAFVVVYKNNKRISLKEAAAIEK